MIQESSGPGQMWTAAYNAFQTWSMQNLLCKRMLHVSGNISRLSNSIIAVVACAIPLLASGDANSDSGAVNFSGDSKRGIALIKQYGCGGCHLIPGVANAAGNVGPPLLHVGTRTYLAGFISNSPENMSLWIQDPQKLLPGNAMPRMGVTPQDSRDITAFLYTLR